MNFIKANKYNSKPKKQINMSQQNQPQTISKKDYDQMIANMTPQQAIVNIEALAKVAISTGVFKQLSESVATDKAITVLANVIVSSIELQQKVMNQQLEIDNLQKQVADLTQKSSDSPAPVINIQEKNPPEIAPANS